MLQFLMFTPISPDELRDAMTAIDRMWKLDSMLPMDWFQPG